MNISKSLLAIALLMIPMMASAVHAQDDAYQQILDEVVANGASGVAIYVRDADGNEWLGASGVSNLETGEPLAADDHFVIYSVAKTFTAVLILQLVEENLMSLDDPIGMWLPEELVSPIPSAEQITIRHLLTQTSGIDQANPYTEIIEDPDPARKYTPEALILDYTLQRGENGGPFAEPGGDTAYYSNTNYTLLALIAEAVTGQPYGDLIAERITQPLSMEDTFVWDYDNGVPVDIISGYTLFQGQLLDLFIDLSFAYGAGNIVSTVGDLGIFTSSLFASDLFQNPETLSVMITDLHPMFPGADYGMGIFRYETFQALAYGHPGDSVGFTSGNFYFPDTGAIIVVLSNFFDVEEAFVPRYDVMVRVMDRILPSN